MLFKVDTKYQSYEMFVFLGNSPKNIICLSRLYLFKVKLDLKMAHDIKMFKRDKHSSLVCKSNSDTN
jgi:hypothetical protein